MKTEKLIEALTKIREIAMDHPAFWGNGDIGAWTMIIILADDALKTEGKPGFCVRCGEMVKNLAEDGTCGDCASEPI